MGAVGEPEGQQSRETGGPAEERSRLFSPTLLEGQIAIVSGGGSGLGREMALELARCGARVVVCGRREEPLLETVALCPRGLIEARACDIREEQQVDALVDQTLERHGQIDLLVNNAGGQFLAPAESITPKGFRTVIRLNVEGTWLMTHAVATKAMIPSGRGGKVFSVTLSPHNGMPGMAHSGAARAAVENLMRTLSVEWARFDIRLLALAAGQFETRDAAYQVSARDRGAHRAHDPAGANGQRAGVRLARRLPGLAGRRFLLGGRDHDGRRPRRLARPVAARAGGR